MSDHSILDYTLTNYLADGETEPVYFGIYWEDPSDLKMQGGRQDVFGRTRHIAGSDLNHTYFGGKGPVRWNYRIWLASRDDHERLEGFKQTYGTLTIPRNIAELPGTDIEREGIVYRVLENVALMDIDSVMIELPETVECVTYWQRNSRDGE